jgi:hypothetical protein
MTTNTNVVITLFIIVFAASSINNVLRSLSVLYVLVRLNKSDLTHTHTLH